MEVIEKSGINKDYLQINKDATLDADVESESDVAPDDDAGPESEETDEDDADNAPMSYIAATVIDPNANYSEQNIEFISFNYVPPDEDDMNWRLENIAYHSYHNGMYDRIEQSSDAEYMHVFDDYANTFSSVIEAADDYIIGRF